MMLVLAYNSNPVDGRQLHNRIERAIELKSKTIKHKISHNVRKRATEHVRPAKIQISLRIRAVWPESSLGANLIAKDA